MKRFLSLLIGLGLLAAVGWYCCWPVVLRLPLPQVEAYLQSHMPQRLWQWNQIQLGLSQPQLRPEGPGRLELQLAMSAKLPLLPAFNGQLQAASGLIYDSLNGKFYLDNPQLKQLEINGFSSQQLPPLQEGMNQLLPVVFREIPVYELDPAQIPERALKTFLHQVEVKDNQLEIHFCNRYAPAFLPAACPDQSQPSLQTEPSALRSPQP